MAAALRRARPELSYLPERGQPVLAPLLRVRPRRVTNTRRLYPTERARCARHSDCSDRPSTAATGSSRRVRRQAWITSSSSRRTLWRAATIRLFARWRPLRVSFGTPCPFDWRANGRKQSHHNRRLTSRSGDERARRDWRLAHMTRKLKHGQYRPLVLVAFLLSLCQASQAQEAPRASPSATSGGEVTLFQNVRVFDGKSTALSGPRNVLVRGNRIEKISTAPIPTDRRADTVAH